MWHQPKQKKMKFQNVQERGKKKKKKKKGEETRVGGWFLRGQSIPPRLRWSALGTTILLSKGSRLVNCLLLPSSYLWTPADTRPSVPISYVDQDQTTINSPWMNSTDHEWDYDRTEYHLEAGSHFLSD